MNESNLQGSTRHAENIFFPPKCKDIFGGRIHKTLVRGVHSVLLHRKEMKWLKVGWFQSPTNYLLGGKNLKVSMRFPLWFSSTRCYGQRGERNGANVTVETR